MLQQLHAYTEQALVAQDGAKGLSCGNQRTWCLRPDTLPIRSAAGKRAGACDHRTKRSPNIEVRMIGGGYGYESSRRSMASGFVLKRSRPLPSQEMRGMTNEFCIQNSPAL
jgi:hypothetical protein